MSNITGSTRPTDPAEHIAKFDTSVARSSSKANWQPPPKDVSGNDDHLRSVNADNIVDQVNQRIKALEARLTETRGFDAKTGLPLLAITSSDPRRQGLELQLHHLKTNELRYAQHRAEQIRAQKAALPTPAQKLAKEVQRQQYIKQSAEELATHLEIEQEARRILEQRRRSGGR